MLAADSASTWILRSVRPILLNLSPAMVIVCSFSKIAAKDCSSLLPGSRFSYAWSVGYLSRPRRVTLLVDWGCLYDPFSCSGWLVGAGPWFLRLLPCFSGLQLDQRQEDPVWLGLGFVLQT